MRLIILTHGGAELVLEKLCGLENIEIAGVFVETRTARKRSALEKLRRSIRYDGVLETLKKFVPGNGEGESPSSIEDRTLAAAKTAGLTVYQVDNFHSDDAIEMMRAANADLGIIYGTNIIRESIFSIPQQGSINLHQGLAPYYRGGPPVFWEIFNDEPEIGLTVHFVASKVDTGDIILQEKYPLSYDFSFGINFAAFIESYRRSLHEESARLVAAAVEMIANGEFDRIPQDISLGKRYRLPTKREKDELRRRLKERIAKRRK